MAGYKINPDQCTRECICSICSEIMFSPIVDSEGDKMCLDCHDEGTYDSPEACKYYKDMFSAKEIGKLLVTCAGVKDGKECEWTGRLSEFNEHEKICELMEIGLRVSHLKTKIAELKKVGRAHDTQMKAQKRAILAQSGNIERQRRVIEEQGKTIRNNGIKLDRVIGVVNEQTTNIARLENLNTMLRNTISEIANCRGNTSGDLCQ